MKKYNIWNRWDPLKAVVLGTVPPAECFYFIEDNKTRSDLERIMDESQKDLEYFEKILKQSAAEVLRTNAHYQKDYERQFEEGLRNGNKLLPKPLVTPRDRNIVIGNKLYGLQPRGYNGFVEDEDDLLDSYNKEDRINLTQQGIDCSIHAPQLTLVGRDLYVDVNGMDPLYFEAEKLGMHPVEMMEKFVHDMSLHVNIIKKMNPGLRIHKLNIGGHNDGSFITFGEGKILSCNYIQDYNKTFPLWKQHNIETLPSVEKFWDWYSFKKKSRGKYFVEGPVSDGFIDFTNEWLNTWMGLVEESHFDVNLFMIDPKTMCVTNPDHPTIRKVAKQYNIELVHIPWKHQFFWDGGLHCLTLDLNREGEMEDYFPERGDEEIRDAGFDVVDPVKLFTDSLPEYLRNKAKRP